MKRFFLLITFFFWNLSLQALPPSSFPFLSEDTWYHYCQWKLSSREGFDPTLVKPGDVILIEDIDCKIFETLRIFETQYLEKIKGPIILVTPRTDFSLPGRFDYFLYDEKIAAWFVQNIDRAPTEKLRPVPIGLPGTRWGYSPTLLSKKCQHLTPVAEKSHFVYVNFAQNREDRKACAQHFSTAEFSFLAEKRTQEQYLSDVKDAVFIASPRGNGLDCHRTWEALLLGCYPIVLSSTLDPLFENLPVLIVDRWEDVTEDLLKEKRKEFAEKTWELEKLYAPYWFKKIESIQEKVRGVVTDQSNSISDLSPPPASQGLEIKPID